jgi:hypothetical protein
VLTKKAIFCQLLERLSIGEDFPPHTGLPVLDRLNATRIDGSRLVCIDFLAAKRHSRHAGCCCTDMFRDRCVDWQA